MNEESIKLIFAFIAGLIPFILKIIFDNYSYKKSQLDKLGVVLFEKQLLIYQELNGLLADYQNNISRVITAGSFGNDVSQSLLNWYKEAKGDKSFEFYQDKKKQIEDFVAGNSILVPDLVLKSLHDYIECSELLYNSWLKGIFEQLPKQDFEFNPDLKLIKTREELIEYNDILFQKYIELTTLLKAIIGTETLKKQIIQYTYTNKPISINVQRIRKANP